MEITSLGNWTGENHSCSKGLYSWLKPLSCCKVNSCVVQPWDSPSSQPKPPRWPIPPTEAMGGGNGKAPLVAWSPRHQGLACLVVLPLCFQCICCLMGGIRSTHWVRKDEMKTDVLRPKPVFIKIVWVKLVFMQIFQAWLTSLVAIKLFNFQNPQSSVHTCKSTVCN